MLPKIETDCIRSNITPITTTDPHKSSQTHTTRVCPHGKLHVQIDDLPTKSTINKT